jgi:hypothetical protein
MEQAFPGSIAAWDKAEAARAEAEKRAAAVRRFRRTMRRLEKRARRMGRRLVANIIRDHRHALGGADSTEAQRVERSLRDSAAELRLPLIRRFDCNRRGAWFREKAADAVARLRRDGGA